MGLLDFPGYRLWEDGRPVPTVPIVAPQVTIYDLRTDPVIYVNNPLVGLHFHLPRAVLDTLADQSGAPRITDLAYPRGSGIDDSVLYNLGMALMPAFRHAGQVHRLFIDHVTLAVTTHVAQTYGGLRAMTPRRGGLAPWQERLAKDILDAHLDGEISQSVIARRCGLSPGHFARGFRVSTGLAPHQWLLRRRVDRAKDLLRRTDTPLAAVARLSGFSDQSHLTRVFVGFVGIPPGAWRRQVRG
jgi:AraC-like DNA-binding protein